ncbi:MAG: nitroreductase [Thermoplasmatota archaeon]
MDHDFMKVIKGRRSIRSFQEKPVEKELIEEIIQAGRFAPSAKNRQPWKFIVITNRDLINHLSTEVKNQMKRMLKHRFFYQFFLKSLRKKKTLQFLTAVAYSKDDSIFYEAPVLVFVVSKKGVFNDESCACCAQNMMLAAHSKGLGSCWIGFANVLGLKRKTLRELKIPGKYHIAASLIFGYPSKKEERASIRRVDADVIEWFD